MRKAYRGPRLIFVLTAVLLLAAPGVFGDGTAPASGPRVDSPRTNGATSLKETLRHAGAWVQQFADDSMFVVANERYDQEYRARSGSSSWQVERRSLLAEIVWVRTPEDEARRGFPWVQFRDVIEVDGEALPEHRGRLERLFKEVSASSYARGRDLIQESARFNIGPIVREINIPSFALFFLHPLNQARFRFTLTGEEIIAEFRAVAIAYRERTRPTMIRSARREDRPAAGTMWIDAPTGRVLKSDIQVSTDRRWTTDTEVIYGHDARLDIWVPMTMRERHHRGTDEYIDATARYSNFRRFETSARIITR